jgi:hypothetical protein
MAKGLNEEIVIDKHFYVPPFVVDVRREGEEDARYDYNPNGGGTASPGDEGTMNPGTGVVLVPPTSYTIVDQTVRIASDGRAVVDVTIEFPDVSGIQSIDVRVTKS